MVKIKIDCTDDKRGKAKEFVSYGSKCLAYNCVKYVKKYV